MLLPSAGVLCCPGHLRHALHQGPVWGGDSRPGRARGGAGTSRGAGSARGSATALPGQVTPTLGRSTPRNATPVCVCVMHKHEGSLHGQAAPWERLSGQCWDNSVLSVSLQALGVHWGPPVKALLFYSPCLSSCPPPVTPDSLCCSLCCGISSPPSAIKLGRLIIKKGKKWLYLSDGGGRLLLLSPRLFAAPLWIIEQASRTGT